MVTKEEVEQFLSTFGVKVKVFDIIYMDERHKNSQALLELEITPAQRTEVITNLTVEDFSERIKDQMLGSDYLWVFGKDVKGKEVYIKISLGRPNSQTICISFHVAEYPMCYPFKTTK